MRTFVFITRAYSSSRFDINNLPAYGRLDVVCRVLNSSFFISHSVRRDVKLYVHFKGRPNPGTTLILDGKELKGFSPDERSIAGFLKKALEVFEQKGKADFEGFRVRIMKLEEILKGKRLFLLIEDGEPLEDIKLPENPVFVIGDHLGFFKEDLKLLKIKKARKVSIGPLSYLSSHCISYINIYLDNLTKRKDEFSKMRR